MAVSAELASRARDSLAGLPSRVLLVSNMFPDSRHPKFGSFVAEAERTVRSLGISVDRAVITDPRTGRFRLILKYASLTARVLAAIVRGGYQQVHAHYLFPSGALARVAARARRVPLVLFAHGSDVLLASWRWPVGAWTKATTSAADLIVVPSEHLRGEIMRVFDVAGDQVAVVPTAVDPSLWYPKDRQDVRTRLSLEPGRPYALFAGALDDNKGRGFEDVIRALADPRLTDLRVVRIGEGPRAESLDRLAEELGVSARIEARGFVGRDELADLYAAADVVVVPSRRESLGLVALEAQASGTPVVATRVGGLPEHVRPGISGELYEPGDVEGLADALCRILSDDARYDPVAAVSAYAPKDVAAALGDAMRVAGRR